MFIVAVANSKGGCGKTTVATHIAAQFAGRGFQTGLADLDRQQSARGWLDRRPAEVARLRGVTLDVQDGKLPKGLDRLVVDCPAAMTKGTVKDVVRRADAIVVPVLPSVFDEDGTRRFLDILAGLKPIRHHRRDIALLANRTRARTRATDRQEAFLTEFEVPLVARVRDSQVYAGAAAKGLSVFETGGRRAQGHRDDWAGLFNFLERSAR